MFGGVDSFAFMSRIVVVCRCRCAAIAVHKKKTKNTEPQKTARNDLYIARRLFYELGHRKINVTKKCDQIIRGAPRETAYLCAKNSVAV